MNQRTARQRSAFQLDFLTFVDSTTLLIEGRTTDRELEGLAVRFSGQSKPFEPKGKLRDDQVVQADLNIPPNGKGRLTIVRGRRKLRVKPGQFSGLSSLAGSYMIRDGWTLLRLGRTLHMYPANRFSRIVNEFIYQLRLLFNWRIPAAAKALREDGSVSRRILKAILIIAESIIMIPRAILLRNLVLIKRSQAPKSWIISDRGMAARDNGEAFFRYVIAKRQSKRNIYFAISKKATDYKRLRQYGPVLNQGSLRYKLHFLLADKIISSHADIEVTNPFLRQLDHFVDLFQFDFVFLQHGIIHNDLSSWLNRFDKNIALFVTSARKEYDSLFAHPYFYDASRVVLTGLPRYDYLQSDPQNKLIIAPTYRNFLLKPNSDRHGVRPYDPDFKKSEYFRFYDALINDKKILKALERAGMSAEFYVHPNFAAQASDFKSNEKVTIPDFPYSYAEAFKTGSLLVSDYSSVVFDFAYLLKPIIYTKFDEERFFKGHTYDKGDFFTDEEDGFGPVTFTYGALVKAITKAIDEKCQMPMEYRKRAEKFFFKRDARNSQRVFEAILAYDKRKR